MKRISLLPLLLALGLAAGARAAPVARVEGLVAAESNLVRIEIARARYDGGQYSFEATVTPKEAGLRVVEASDPAADGCIRVAMEARAVDAVLPEGPSLGTGVRAHAGEDSLTLEAGQTFPLGNGLAPDEALAVRAHFTVHAPESALPETMILDFAIHRTADSLTRTLGIGAMIGDGDAQWRVEAAQVYFAPTYLSIAMTYTPVDGMPEESRLAFVVEGPAQTGVASDTAHVDGARVYVCHLPLAGDAPEQVVLVAEPYGVRILLDLMSGEVTLPRR